MSGLPGSASSALFTDRYELTMVAAALADGTAHRRCTVAWHPGHESCVSGHLATLPELVKRALRIYIPVHLLPLLLFKLPVAVKKPASTVAKLSVSVAKSTAFLSTAVFLCKLTICVLRAQTRCVGLLRGDAVV